MKIMTKQLLILAVLWWSTSVSAEKLLTDQKVLKYFDEVVYGSEFNKNSAVIRKWSTDVKIYVKGDPPRYLMDELNSLIAELNKLVAPVKVHLVSTIKSSNLLVYFGKGSEYGRLEPSAKQYVRKNYGLFWVYWDKHEAINRGSIYVDTTRANTPRWQKHLLREELTQAMGIMRDSHTYKDSVFYQQYSTTTSYAAIDKAVIVLLYNPQITPGMSRKTASKILKKLLAQK